MWGTKTWRWGPKNLQAGISQVRYLTTDPIKKDGKGWRSRPVPNVSGAVGTEV